ncbi:MAG: hypothetical protein AB1733_07810 [Thermodesulfobacteriota bacterium]
MPVQIRYLIASLVTLVPLLVLAGSCPAEDLTVKNCPELVRIAETCQEDLKTVDTVLGSAIEAGSIDRIRNYKLRKAEIKKRLHSVMRVIELKECVLPR